MELNPEEIKVDLLMEIYFLILDMQTEVERRERKITHILQSDRMKLAEAIIEIIKKENE